MFKLCNQTLVSAYAILDRCPFVLAERNLLQEPRQVLLPLKQQRRTRFFRHIEVALGTSHAMWALLEEVVGAIPVSQIVKFPRLARGASVAYDLLVNEYLDCTEVPREIACIGVGFRELRRSDLGIVLRCGRRAVA